MSIHPQSYTVESVVLAFPREGVPAATEFRSTWVVSSLEGLRLHGHFDRYLERLEPAYRDDVLHCVAGAWLPMAVVRAHYEACEALALDPDEVARMAREGGSVRRAWHASVIAAAQRPDSNIWSILSQLHKLWQRSANGGATAVFRLAETRARVDYVGCALLDIPFFRDALTAVLTLLGSHICPGLRVTAYAGERSGTASYVMEWD